MGATEIVAYLEENYPSLLAGCGASGKRAKVNRVLAKVRATKASPKDEYVSILERLLKKCEEDGNFEGAARIARQLAEVRNVNIKGVPEKETSLGDLMRKWNPVILQNWELKKQREGLIWDEKKVAWIPRDSRKYAGKKWDSQKFEFVDPPQESKERGH